jgi:hypothetical protein
MRIAKLAFADDEWRSLIAARAGAEMSAATG